jgi:hypothetical protein
MGLFQGNLNNTDKGLHLFTTDDKSLALLGLSSFTVASISGYFQENRNTLKEFFSQQLITSTTPTTNLSDVDADNAMKNLLGLGPLPKLKDFQILAFNSDNKKYNMKTGATDIFNNMDGGSGLPVLCQQHDWAEYGYLNDTPATKELVVSTINNIQNSASGCLSYSPQFYVRGQLRSAEIKVFFQDKANRSNDRVVAEKNDPKTKMLVGVPRRASGGQYGWSSTNASTSIGAYNQPAEGGVNNPENTVAAPLKMIYNKSLGMWESGTQQMLARLLTDIDAAAIPRLIPDLDTIDNLPSEALYDSDSANYMSQFTVGEAIPLCLENCNPHMFGPNIKSDCNNEKEKIRVVNRAPRSFKKNDVVMCSMIDSEWILQGFDTPTVTPVETKITKWFFQKYIADSSYYFRDGRLHSMGSPANIISPDIYESKTRKRYYMSLANLGLDDSQYYSPSISNVSISNLQKLGESFIVNDFLKLALMNLNLDTPDSGVVNLTTSDFPTLTEYDFHPSSGYYQSSIFDNLGYHMGGLNPNGNVIKRTNVEVSPNGQAATYDAGDYEKLAGFWGPLFPDGYNAAQIADFKKNRSNNKKRYRSGKYHNAINQINQYFNMVEPSSSDPNVLSSGINENMQRDYSNFLFSDANDANLKQLPAEVALNGSVNSSNGSPIEDLHSLGTCFRGNIIDQFYKYFNSPWRYEWLATSGSTSGITPFYGFTPVKPNRIQFSPLQTEFALNDAYLTPEEQVTNGVNANNIVPLFKGAKYFRADNLQDRFYNANLWGDLFFKRWQAMQGGGISTGTPDVVTVPDDPTNPPHIRYGDQVAYPNSSNVPTGGPRIFPQVDGKEKSNVVGIIAAKNKFVTQPGGTIVFNTKQYSGLTPTYQVAGGGGGFVGILNMGGGQAIVLQDPFTGAKQYSLKNWGSIGDNYSDFGTTALYVRVFDQWPDEQTIYDGRYFSVLHFNPDKLGWDVQTSIVDSGVVFNNNVWTPASGQPSHYPRYVDKATSSVDFRIPTTCNPKTPSEDNKIIPAGTTITKDGVTGLDATLRKPSEWRVNPIRRGQLLTNGGFRYYKRIVGLVDPYNPMANLSIEDGGMGYAVDDVVKFINKASCLVTAVNDTGGITAVSFIDKNGNFTIGEGFTPEDFKTNLTHSSVTTTSGIGLKMECTAAVVYDIIQKDIGPQDRFKNIQKLTLGSNMGEKEAAGELVTSIKLENNGTGKYEAFYHFHNDIMHTITQSQTLLTIGRFPQYVTMEIKAG